MNAAQIRSRIHIIELLLKKQINLYGVDTLPSVGESNAVYLYNDNFYTWNGSTFVPLIPTDLSQLTDNTNLIPQDLDDLEDSLELLKWENDIYSDWYLPSSDEMTAIVSNLYANGLGSILEDIPYWTSTETAAGTARVIGPMFDISESKDAVRHIRPVRNFTSERTYVLQDVGPSGGYIFSIDSTDVDNPIYYEAAPADIDDAAWSNIVDVEIGTTGTAIGTGLANTNLIVAQDGHTTSAAQDCLDHVIEFANRIRPINTNLVRGLYIDGTYNEVKITRDALKVLKDAKKLVVGQKYLITDFAQSYNIFDGGDNTIIEEQVGTLEPIIVTAISSSELDKVAISTLYPQDIIHYSIDLLDDRDIGFGDGAGNPTANFKGMIYYREDTVQNVSTHYDFRNVKFRRWAVDAVEWTDIGFTAKDVIKSASDGKIYKCIVTHGATGTDPSADATNWILWLNISVPLTSYVSWTIDNASFNIGDITTTNLIIVGATYQDLLTFGDVANYSYVKGVKIESINLDWSIDNISFNTTLNNNVFKTIDDYNTCTVLNFGLNTLNNTFCSKANNINIIGTFLCNVFQGCFVKCEISKSGTNNIIVGEFSSNKIGEDFQSNVIEGSFSANSIQQGFRFNNIRDSFNYNSIQFNFQYNLIRDNFSYNIIGNYNSQLIIGSNFQYNTMANRIKTTVFYSIIFGDNVTMCNIQDAAFGVLAADLDLSAATHLSAAYDKTIYYDKTLGTRLSYLDNDVIQRVAVTA